VCSRRSRKCATLQAFARADPSLTRWRPSRDRRDTSGPRGRCSRLPERACATSAKGDSSNDGRDENPRGSRRARESIKSASGFSIASRFACALFQRDARESVEQEERKQAHRSRARRIAESKLITESRYQTARDAIHLITEPGVQPGISASTKEHADVRGRMRAGRKQGENAVKTREKTKKRERERRSRERNGRDKGESTSAMPTGCSIATFIIDTEALEEPIPLPGLFLATLRCRKERAFPPSVRLWTCSIERAIE
jgi:hypothetical protein